jgi:hypothetical protein
MILAIGNLCLILCNSPVCQTLSKAWAMSKNTAVQYCFLFHACGDFVAYPMSLVDFRVTFSESKLVVGYNNLDSGSFLILLSSSLSNILERIDSKLIGR